MLARTVLSSTGFLWLALFATVSQAVAPPAAPSEADIQKLVEELGNKDPKVQKNAFKRLQTIGKPAFEALQAAAQNPPSPAVGQRAEFILKDIGTGDRPGRLQALQIFVDKGTLPSGDVLPGWDRLSKVAGDTPAARLLYQEIYHADRELLEAYHSDLEQAAKVLQARLEDPDLGKISNGKPVVERTAPQVALFFLVAGDDRIQLEGDFQGRLLGETASMTMVLGKPGLTFVPKPFAKDPIFQKLIGIWVGRPVDSDAVSMAQIWLAAILKLKSGISTAKVYLQREDGDDQIKISAMSLIGLAGDRKDVAFVEPYLEDSTSWGTITNSISGGLPNTKTETPEIQARDAALATLVLLTKQKLGDYNLEAQESAGTTSFYFEDAEGRESAIAKWRAWAKENVVKTAEPSP